MFGIFYADRFRRARKQRQLTQAAVAKSLRVSQGYIAQIEAGRTVPSPRLASRISNLLGADLNVTEGREENQVHMLAEPAERFERQLSRRPEGLPLMGTPVRGDDERIVLDGQTRGFVPCPFGLKDVPGAHAAYVRGRSMEPRYYPGELIYVDPTRPPNPGDFVLVAVREPQFASPIGYLRRFLGGDAEQVRIATLNPKRTQRIARKAVVSLNTVVGSGLL